MVQWERPERGTYLTVSFSCVELVMRAAPQIRKQLSQHFKASNTLHTQAMRQASQDWLNTASLTLAGEEHKQRKSNHDQCKQPKLFKHYGICGYNITNGWHVSRGAGSWKNQG